MIAKITHIPPIIPQHIEKNAYAMNRLGLIRGVPGQLSIRKSINVIQYRKIQGAKSYGHLKRHRKGL